MILCKLKPEEQQRAIWLFYRCAQITFLLSILLERLPLTWLHTRLPADTIDFISGFLTGLTIVAWIVFLGCSGKIMKNPNRRLHPDD